MKFMCATKPREKERKGQPGMHMLGLTYVTWMMMSAFITDKKLVLLYEFRDKRKQKNQHDA